METRPRTGKPKRYIFLLVVVMITVEATPQPTTYSNTPNKELKARVIRLVKDIRALGYAYEKKDREMMAAFEHKNRSDARPPERKAIREQWIRDSEGVHNSFMREYKEKYWADAILLRNELYRRLPKKMREPQLATMYQYPTNIKGVEVVADNLELLSKSLVDN